jgi:hypothetical protein
VRCSALARRSLKARMQLGGDRGCDPRHSEPTLADAIRQLRIGEVSNRYGRLPAIMS